MAAVKRIGDADSGGGKVTAGVNNVIVNGRPISVNGKPVSGHAPGIHAGPVTANGLTNVIAGGIPVNVIGNADTCGHARAEGSPNVVAG